MPGGVAGGQPKMPAPYADSGLLGGYRGDPCNQVLISGLAKNKFGELFIHHSSAVLDLQA